MSENGLAIMKNVGRNAVLIVLLGGISVLLSLWIVAGGITSAGLFVGLPIGLVFAGMCLSNPKIGMIVYIHLSFFVIGLSRFFPPSIPYGMAVDGILALCLIGTLFKAKKEDLRRIHNPFFYLVLFWFFFTFVELVNPEARSKEAWFYAVRGVSFYWVQTLPVVFIFMYKKEDMDRFIRIWLFWSFIAALWAFKQQYISLTDGEKQWLEDGGKITHVLMGKLRSFSFYSDAGQYGANMAHTTVFTLIMYFGSKKRKEKLLYLFLTVFYFWGFAVSGSRGPLFVLAGGIVAYLFLIKNFRLLIVGLAIGVLAFGFLKFTTIGQGNYQIQRLRSALDPNDASFQVRLENQAKLKIYLASRPLGGGIGSGGTWGQRFTPGSFLAETALDSWYVKIWVETGVVGLIIHVASMLVFIFIGFKKVYNLTEPDLRRKMLGLYCGFVGVAVASYGNQIFGQMPTSTIVYFSMVYFYVCDTMEKEELRKQLPQNQE